MGTPYSDLEVTPSDPNLEHFTNGYQAGLEHDTTKPNLPQAHFDSQKEAYNLVPPQHRRICGLTPRTFWIIAIVGIVVIIGAAVGGGVGGSLASKKSSDAVIPSSTSGSSAQSLNTSPASSGRSTDSTTPSPTSSVALTTTQITGPSYTLLRDCPSSNNTLYGVTLGSAEMNFRKICGMSYLNTQGGGDTVNTKASSLDSCINLCAEYNVQNASAIASGQNNICNAVCWRNSLDNDDFPGQCFGFTTQNSSDAFVTKIEGRCDSAAWVDQKIL
jgi:hypothetical protein